MRQVFLKKGTIVVKHVSQPLLDESAILVAVHYSFISSGTELASIAHSKESQKHFTSVPEKIKKVLQAVASDGIDGASALIKGKLKGELQTLGYSCSGIVIAVGKKVTRLRVGDLVACAGAGYANHADIVCIPESLAVKVKDRAHLRAASLTTIGSIAMQGIRRANVQIGEFVCVFGLGLLGQLTVQLAKQAGCRVIGFDLVAERLELAQRLGADYVFNPSQHDIAREIAFLTEHQGVDVTIITAAAHDDTIIQQSMEITRKKGRVVLVGDVAMKFDRNPCYQKEIDFLISCSYGPGRYDATYEQRGRDYPYAYVRWTENRNMQSFLHLIEQEKIVIDPLISAQVTLDTIDSAYTSLLDKQGLGVVVEYNHGDDYGFNQPMALETPHPTAHEIRFTPARTDTLRVGIVGAGGFAKVKLLPLISRIKHARIDAIVDANITNAINAGQVYKASRTMVHDEELFQEDLVDIVVIASPHKFHAAQALRALQNGKAVFVEKPLATDFAQFNELSTFLKNNPRAPLCVDYNRSHAPFIKKIKQAISQRTTPLVVHYRMNAGFIPREHWIQTDIGAGRIIGEACHIIDLFCYLTDSRPTAVSVEALHAGAANIFPTDNFIAQISFEDGSICSLLYTSLGHEAVGKERMELFFDSKTIVMDDYQILSGYGLPKTFDDLSTMPDKGHENLLRLFFDRLSKNQEFTHPIGVDRMLTGAYVTLVIDQLACEGGGTKELGSLR